jgi:2-C-methyl-D-erythritol 2,4-cyclodiphosphate synthase
MQKFRIGLGYDVHRLELGRPLILGGVEVPFEKGCMGHSDADVILHVICDAMLGAANLRNIGYHFSDKDPRWKGANSQVFLKEVNRMVLEKGYTLGNIDVTIACQEPKLNPFIPAMQELIAKVLETDVDNISIKATTGEHIGFVGRSEGVAAHCVTLLYKA